MSDAEAPAAEEAELEAPPEPGPETLHGAPVTSSRGQPVLHATPGTYLALVEALRADGFDLLADVTATDYLTNPHRELPAGIEPQRFELVANLVSLAERRRVRIRVQVPEDDPVAPSITTVYLGAEAAEREVYDMFGIVFDGHPDLTRILMPEDWEGHPLRKDYSLGRIPVQFKSAPSHR